MLIYKLFFEPSLAILRSFVELLRCEPFHAVLFVEKYDFNVSCPCLLIPFVSKQNLSQHRKILQARKKARNKVEAVV